jgi:hypothetical protein
MEDMKLTVTVEVTLKDDKFFYNILAQKGMNVDEILTVLCGGVALSIRGKETPKLQAEAIKDVITYLESEFINVDSFSDVNFKKHNLD